MGWDWEGRRKEKKGGGRKKIAEQGLLNGLIMNFHDMRGKRESCALERDGMV